MGVWDLVSMAFGAQAGDGPTPLVTPSHHSSNQHIERRQSSENNPFPSAFDDIPCLCSFVTHEPRPTGITIPKEVASVASRECPLLPSSTTTTGPETPVPNPPSASPVASTTPPLTSSSTQSTIVNSPTLTSSPTLTTTVGIAPMSNGISSPFPSPSTSSGSDASRNMNTFVSSSNSQSSFQAVASRSTVAASDSSASRSSALSPAAAISPLPYSPLSGRPSSASPMPSDSHRLNIGTIIGIALGAFAVVICVALTLFFLLRLRARRRVKCMSVDSSRRRLKPYSYDDAPSRPISAVWTWLGRSASLDPDFEPRPGPSPHSLDFQFAAEKDAPATAQRASEAYTLSPCPSPALAETEPLARGVSPLVPLARGALPLVPLAPSAHEDPSHQTVPSPGQERCRPQTSSRSRSRGRITPLRILRLWTITTRMGRYDGERQEGATRRRPLAMFRV